MKYCKKVCQTLKEVRKQIADANEIPYEITECHHEGNCQGTCPKCESEVRYIENQLNIRRASGKAVSLLGISLGISAAFSSCLGTASPQPSSPEDPSSADLEGDVVLVPPTQKDSMLPDSNSSEKLIPKVTEIEEIVEVDGDIILDDFLPAVETEVDSIITIMDSLTEEESPLEGESPDEDSVFLVADEQPEFPGGESALKDFLSKNLQYPPILEGAIQGRVHLSFIVERDGTISSIEVLRSPDKTLSDEAIRVVRSMPKWKPGKKKGHAVRVKYVLPVTFRLS